MKIIVTHTSPDMDAITSVWVIKRFLQGWEDAQVQYVYAGKGYKNSEARSLKLETRQPIEQIDGDEVITVDTGLGPLDHHQTSDSNVCGASLAWEFVKVQSSKLKDQSFTQEKIEAIDRLVKVVVAIDHFQEIFWGDPTADYQEFQLVAILEGLKYEKPNDDNAYTEFVMQCLDAILHTFENRIWAEKEIAEKGVQFKTKWGKGIGFETINDTVVKLSQRMGYEVVIRKDPRKGYVRIKARPVSKLETGNWKLEKSGVDLTLVYEQLKKIDPEATWFLHAGKKMLLNGTAKNPSMVATKLTLSEIISVLEKAS